LNPGYTDYRLPTAADLPKIETVLVEDMPAPYGPFGAKGVGEPPITPTMAMIANAIADATGVRVTKLPITPEKIVMALKAI
jgi:CO/xanthine dehydrogenase Mo-binding subunit